MTTQSKNLVRALLKFYFEGRPHTKADCGGCKSCHLWDEIESNPESAFDELEAELSLTTSNQ